MTTTPGFRFAVRDVSPNGSQLLMSDRWGIITGSALSSFPISKLQTDLLSDFWGAYNHRSSNCWVEGNSGNDAQGNISTTRNIGAIGLLGINRRSAAIPTTISSGATPNTFRIRVDNVQISDRIRPSFTITSKTNLSGADTNLTTGPIDPPDDPAPSGYAETELTPTNPALATGVVVTFANHYSTERALSGTQTIRVHVREVTGSQLIPIITTAIYQSGVFVKTLTSPLYEFVAVTNADGGFIASYTFLASDLTSQTAAIQLHVDTSTACNFVGIEWVANLTGHLYDSGVLDFAGIDLTMLAVALDRPIGAGINYVHIEPSDFCSYSITDYAKVGGGPEISAYIYTSIVNPGEPDGRFHAGRFLAADAIIFPINGLAGYNLTTSSDASPSRTRSGSFHGSRAANEWIEADLSIIGISRVLQQRLERLFRALGIMRNPTLLIPDPLMTEGYIDEQTTPRWVVLASKAESHIGRLTGIDSDVSADGLNHTRDRWDMAVHVVEHNAVRSGGR